MSLTIDESASIVLERVIATISRYSMIAPDARVGVAVSGGADSVCLLHLLRELAARWNLRLTVLHFNHKLRGPESDTDEAFVRELAANLGLPFESRSADVAAISLADRDNLEQTARRLRRAYFEELLAGNLDCIALGHTRSDQAETVLFRLLRGAGLCGLAGILPVTREGLVRPLIDIERVQVEIWLRERGIAWRDDSTNLDRAFARNRIRHDLLPALTAEWNSRLSASLANLARLAQDEEQFWDGYITDLAARTLEMHPGEMHSDAVLIRADGLVSLHPAVARRLIRRAARIVKGDLRQIESDHIERILDLAAQPEGHGRLQIPGVDVFRSFDWIRFAKRRPGMFRDQDYELGLPVPGVIDVPRSGTKICLEVIEKASSGNTPGTCATLEGVDWRRVPGPLSLRNWRPGDQYQPLGHSHEQKIKLLFHQSRIPLWERRGWPIITSEGRIVWVRKFGPAAEYAASSDSGTILHIWEQSARAIQ